MRALTPQQLRCSVTGKTAYVSAERAELAIAAAWRDPRWHGRHAHGLPKRAYLCEHCGWFHMTHKRDAR
jgi:hypothetical protein